MVSDAIDRQGTNPDTLDFANVRNYRIIFVNPCQGVLFIIVFLCGLLYMKGMTNLAFDTHTAVKELEQAGMPVKQAESVVATLRKSREFDVSHLATKMDVAKLDKKIDNVAATLDRKIDNVAATLDRKIDGVKSELKTDIATLDKKIDEVKSELKADILSLENRLTIRLGGMMVAGIAVVAALVEVL